MAKVFRAWEVEQSWLYGAIVSGAPERAAGLELADALPPRGPIHHPPRRFDAQEQRLQDPGSPAAAVSISDLARPSPASHSLTATTGYPAFAALASETSSRSRSPSA
jgi:hypothetical protein